MQNDGKDFDSKLNDFCKDNVSGSVSLFREALDIIRTIIRTSSDENFKPGIEVLVEKLLSCHPDMAIIMDLGTKVAAIMDSDKSTPILREAFSDLVEAELNKLETSFRKITEEAAKFLNEKSTIVTLSRSETVLIVLHRLYEEGMVERVVISESRPCNEGAIMAKDLASRGIPVTLVVDSALDRMAINADAAIIGADAVYEDGSVKNKIGSRSLALSCKNRGIPFIVVSQSQKITGRVNDSVEHIELMPVSEITPGDLPENVSAMNFYFEIVERALIDRIIMEDRVMD